MRCAILIVVVTAAPQLGARADPPVKESQIVRPSVWWSGLNRFSDGGGRVEPVTRLVTDAGEFAKLWTRFGLKVEAPQVDFRNNFVLVLLRPLGLDFEVGGLTVDEHGASKARGMPVHPDFMNSSFHSTTIAVFPRDGIKSVEGKKLPAVPE
jgi:hypothetical protein